MCGRASCSKENIYMYIGLSIETLVIWHGFFLHMSNFSFLLVLISISQSVGMVCLLGELFSSRIKFIEMDGLIAGTFQRRNFSLSLKTPTSIFE